MNGRQAGGVLDHKFSASSKVILWTDDIPSRRKVKRLITPSFKGQAYSCSRK